MKMNTFFSQTQTEYLTKILNKYEQSARNHSEQNKLSLQQMDDKISKLEEEMKVKNAQLSALQLKQVKMQIAANVIMVLAWGVYEILK